MGRDTQRLWGPRRGASPSLREQGQNSSSPYQVHSLGTYTCQAQARVQGVESLLSRAISGS